MARSFPRVQAAAIDGRLHTIYHRQEELEKLCKSLISNVESIKYAIAADYGHTATEIATEYSLTLKAVKHYYSLSDPSKAHAEEYLIANGKDAPKNRVPIGIVYIEPTEHTLFYSTVVPLAAAIAAGNCVVVLLENNIKSVSGLLRRILSEALDADIFAIASAPIEDEDLLSKSFSVYQNGSKYPLSLRRLASRPEDLIVAVVDRTADVELAANELAAARFGFAGRSPYAPDVVLVNEFKKDAFVQALLRESRALQSIKERSNSDIEAQIAKLKAKPTVQENGFAVVDISTRNVVLTQKTSSPVLAIHSIKSLDDAIDLVNQRLAGSSCAAAYHFANLASCKYLAQFIPSQATFVNHFPRDLLVGPLAPRGWFVQPTATERYRIEMFLLPRPAFVNTGKESLELVSASAEKLLAEATMPLKEMKRHPGGGIGFFEKGFLINAGLILASVLIGSTTGLVWFWRSSRPI